MLDDNQIYCPGPAYDNGVRDEHYGPGCPNVTDPCPVCEGAGNFRLIWGGPGMKGQYHSCFSCKGSGQRDPEMYPCKEIGCQYWNDPASGFHFHVCSLNTRVDWRCPHFVNPFDRLEKDNG